MCNAFRAVIAYLFSQCVVLCCFREEIQCIASKGSRVSNCFNCRKFLDSYCSQCNLAFRVISPCTSDRGEKLAIPCWQDKISCLIHMISQHLCSRCWKDSSNSPHSYVQESCVPLLPRTEHEYGLCYSHQEEAYVDDVVQQKLPVVRSDCGESVDLHQYSACTVGSDCLSASDALLTDTRDPPATSGANRDDNAIAVCHVSVAKEISNDLTLSDSQPEGRYIDDEARKTAVIHTFNEDYMAQLMNEHNCRWKRGRLRTNSAGCRSKNLFSALNRRQTSKKINAAFDDGKSTSILVSGFRIIDPDSLKLPSGQIMKYTWYECSHCSLAFSHKYAFNKHIKCHCSLPIVSSARSCWRCKKSKSHKGSHACCLCNKEFAAKLSLRLHFQTNHINTEKCFSCDKCHAVFICRQYLVRHKANVHVTGSEPELQCRHCSFRCSFPAVLKSHEERHGRLTDTDLQDRRTTGFEPAKATLLSGRAVRRHCSYCSECVAGNVAESMPYRATNAEPHKGPHLCIDCGKAYSLRGSLRLHWRQVHCDHSALFHCNLCGTEFISERSLSLHIGKRHSNGQKPFCCRKCGFQCMSRNALKNHRYREHEEKNKQCEVCGRGFKNTQSLCEHMLVHKGLKPFSCERCGRTFRTKKQLRNHILGHHSNIQRPFRCDKCERGFRKQQNLTQHRLSHTGEKPYKCSVCSSTFARKDYLQKHFSTHSNTEHVLDGVSLLEPMSTNK